VSKPYVVTSGEAGLFGSYEDGQAKIMLSHADRVSRLRRQLVSHAGKRWCEVEYGILRGWMDSDLLGPVNRCHPVGLTRWERLAGDFDL
jgi:hypothetical protein